MITVSNPGGSTCAIDRDGLLTLTVGSARLSGQVTGRLASRSLSGRRILEIIDLSAEDQHGSGIGFSARLETESPDIILLCEVMAYDAQPFIALRAGLLNLGHTSLPAESLSPFTSRSLVFGDGPLDGWVNGYHSWSFTGFIPHTMKQPRQWPGRLLAPHSINTASPLPRHPGQYAAEWVGALITPGRDALVAGFIGVERYFAQVISDGRPGSQSLRLVNSLDGVQLSPGDLLWGEWAILYPVVPAEPDPLAVYADAVARLTPPRWPHPSPLPGWSSWYQFFADVTLPDMERNQSALAALCDRLPLGLIQLDDGYQPHWGDWLDHNEKFPGGVPGWAAYVREGGFEPGLWLSPFTVDKESRIARDHPDALLRDARGRILHGGFLINRWIKGLDPTHPAVEDFVRETIATIVHDWGIRYLKLDFLYCGALPGIRHDPALSRAQALRRGFQLIREVAGDEVTLLGCGCPLGPAIGIFDMMRVSPDVAPYWYPQVFGLKKPFRGDYSLPSARNSLSNTLGRTWQHRRWWWCDADNLLVRAEQDLTESEVKTLATLVGMTSSHLIVSDDLPLIDEVRAGWAASLIPHLDGRSELPTAFRETNPSRVIRRYQAPDGPVILLALVNWQDEPRTMMISRPELGLPPGNITVTDFWGRTAFPWVEGDLSWPDLPPHGVVLAAFRSGDGPRYLGGDLHFSMGAELSRWQQAADQLSFTLAPGKLTGGRVYLRLDRQPLAAACNDLPVMLEALGDGIFSLVLQAGTEMAIAVRFA